MELKSVVAPTRHQRFRRTAEPPPFRLTDDDVEIVRQLARHGFLRSTHIAALVCAFSMRATSTDRQLDFYPAGSAHLVMRSPTAAHGS
jgi:hypothetical protein